MIRRPPRSTRKESSAASDVYKRQITGEEKEIYLGDIIINLNKIKNKKVLKNFKIEFDRLWIHGLLHLFGYDHIKGKDYLKMHQIEKKYFNLIND